MSVKITVALVIKYSYFFIILNIYPAILGDVCSYSLVTIFYFMLQTLSSVILEPKKIKSAPPFTFPPSICHESWGPDAMILVF